MHPFIVGELACGSLADRASILELLQDLPEATVADADEVVGFIERHRLYCKGVGYVDVHLRASTSLTRGAALWTKDQRLGAAAEALGIAHRETN